MPRLWFLNQDGTRLVQVQRDYFVFNWRRQETTQPYPRYETLKQQLVEELERFHGFLENEKLPAVRPTQVELTYVNHIDARNVDGSRKPLSQVIRVWATDRAVGHLPRFEDASFNARYVIQEGDAPAGRLHVSLDPRNWVKDNAPLYLLTLVARGAPRTPDMDAAFEFLDKGHEAIVEGFTALTTDEMHGIWERQR